jgi:hypothetical protein
LTSAGSPIFRSSSWCGTKAASAEAARIFVLCGQRLAAAPRFTALLLRSAYYAGSLDRHSRETPFSFETHFTHCPAHITPRFPTTAYCDNDPQKLESDAIIGSRASLSRGKRQAFHDQGPLAIITHFARVTIASNYWIEVRAIITAEIAECSLVSTGADIVTEASTYSIVPRHSIHSILQSEQSR